MAAPAIAQFAPEIRWHLTPAFPKSLDTLFGGSELLAKSVTETTEGMFIIQPFAPGEIMGAPQAFDDIGTAIPFGLNARRMNAWLYHGNGNDLLNEFYAKHNMFGLPAGNTGVQMGGWFRKEVKTVQDLQGLESLPSVFLKAKLG